MPSRRPLVLAGVLAASLVLAGCSLFDEKANDPDSNYAGGPGAQLGVRNDGNETFQVVLRLTDLDGRLQGMSNVTLAPGESATRRFSTPGATDLRATIQYQYSGHGRASSGIDERLIPREGCPDLVAASWTVANVEKTAGAQWHEGDCTPP